MIVVVDHVLLKVALFIIVIFVLVLKMDLLGLNQGIFGQICNPGVKSKLDLSPCLLFLGHMAITLVFVVLLRLLYVAFQLLL